MLEDMSEEMWEDTSIKMLGNMSEKMPKDILEKDGRRYVRRNITKNVFIKRTLLNSNPLGA